MSRKTVEKKRKIRAWHRYYENRIAEEKGKIRGYEELARIHSAYITVLLKRLGATEDNMVTITAEEVKEALTKYETRVVPADGGCSLYCEVVEE